MAVKIGLDAGHGLRTAGKQTPTGIKEWTINDKVRDKVVKILADYDVEIVNTDNDEGYADESLSSRVTKYRSAGVKAFVSIHHNAFTGTWNNATGVGVYIDKNHTAKDNQLANAIYTRLVKYTGLRGRGVQKANFTVINQNTIPAVLVEGGFMDGSKDYAVITSDAGQTAYAKAVAEGLIEFLGLKKKSNATVKPTTTTTSTYTGSSIVEYLKSIGKPYDFASREKLAAQYGISGYKGTASQNLKLLSLLRGGVKPTTTSSTYTLEQFIRDVQACTGSKVDGIAGPETIGNTVTVSMSKNKNHAVVTPLERRLKALGYYSGEIEADHGERPNFGDGMKAAVNNYQKNVLKYRKQDGEITAGNKMWKKLLGMI